MTHVITTGLWEFYPPRPPRPRCAHCTKGIACKSRGLCSVCYADRAIRACYGKSVASNPAALDQPERDPRPQRKPGEKPWWCFWCRRWECDAPLKLCAACQEDYERMWDSLPPEMKLANPVIPNGDSSGEDEAGSDDPEGKP